jgi:hypothetical protein
MPFGGPPQCGERYSHLLVVNGNTADKPCGLLTAGGAGCFYFHAEAWVRRADEVWFLVRSAWNELVRRENERQQWEDSRQLRPQVEEFERAAESMERWSAWEGTIGAGLDYNKRVVDGAAAVTRLGACALDRLNQAIERLAGGTIEPGASPESSMFPGMPNAPEGLGGAVLLGLAALALFYFTREKS